MALIRQESGEFVFRNPVWTTTGTIAVEVEHDLYGWIPFNASPNDPEDHGRELFELLTTTYAHEVEPCPGSKFYEVTKSDVNARRDKELANSDWVMTVDSQVANQSEWIAYRQALRDITEQVGYPYEVFFPSKPE